MNNGRWHSEGKFLVDPQGQTVGEIDLDRIGEVVTALDAHIMMLGELDQNTGLRLPRRTYHGWIVISEEEPGYRPTISVEWNESGKDRHFVAMTLKGNSGAAQAVEWWDTRVGQRISLEPLGAFGYRVYTDETR